MVFCRAGGWWLGAVGGGAQFIAFISPPIGGLGRRGVSRGRPEGLRHHFHIFIYMYTLSKGAGGGG